MRRHHFTAFAVVSHRREPRLGLDVASTERDAGISGRHGHEARPGLAAVLERVQADPEVAVVVYSLSRLGRTQRHVAELLDDRGPYRVRLVSVTEPIDMTTAMGRAVAGIITAFAARVRLGVGTYRGRAGVRRAGGASGSVPRAAHPSSSAGARDGREDAGRAYGGDRGRP